MDGPVRPPLAIFACPIDRIDDPDAAFLEPLGRVARFLAQDTIVGTGLFQRRHQQRVGASIAFLAQRAAFEFALCAQIEQQLARFLRQPRGQIAIVSSIVGFRDMPGTPAYSASKAAVKAYGEALRGWLAADGIKVSVVCPGFVRTRMTDNNPYPMPLIIDPDKAARIIRRGLERNKARIVFPWPMHLAALLLAVLPPAWTDPLLTRAPKKD